MAEKIEIVLVEESSTQQRNQPQPSPPSQPVSPSSQSPSAPPSAPPSAAPPTTAAPPIAQPQPAHGHSPGSRPTQPQAGKYEILSLRAAILLLAERFLPRNITRWLDAKTKGLDANRDDDTQLGKFVGKLDSWLARLLKDPLKLPQQPATPAATNPMQYGLGWKRTAATGTATGAATGAAGGAAGGATAGAGVSLAAVAAVVAGVVFVLAGIAYAGKKLLDMFSNEAKRLAEFGGAVAGAKVEIEMNQMERDLRRSEKIGPQLAQMELHRDKLAEAQHETMTAIYELLLEGAPLMKMGIDLLTVVMRQVEAGTLGIKAVYQVLRGDIAGALTSGKGVIDAEVKAAAAAANLFLPDTPAQNADRWILDQNPFGANAQPNQLGPQQQPNPFGGP
jgi:hypothetical protein